MIERDHAETTAPLARLQALAGVITDTDLIHGLRAGEHALDTTWTGPLNITLTTTPPNQHLHD